MADLAAARALEAARLTGRIRRHVVVVHIALAGLGAQTLDHLHLAHRREGRDGHDLRLAAGENAAAVDARQHAGLAPDGADLGQAAAVGTDALLQNLLAHDLLVEVVERVIDLAEAALEALGVLLVRLGGDDLLPRAALMAVGRLKDPLAAAVEILADGGLDILARFDDRIVALLLADLGDDLLLERDDLLDLLMAGQDRAEHVRLADLLGAGLDHQHSLVGAGHGQAQLRHGALLEVRIDDDLAIDQADGDAADRTRPRDIADGDGRGSADHRGDIRRHILLDGKHGRHNLHIVAHALVEQRAKRAIDEAGGQRRLLGRTALALDESAGNLANGIHLLLKIDAQREEILSLARGFGGRHIDHDHRIAETDDHGAIRLSAVFAKLQHQLAASQLCAIHLFHRGISFQNPACNTHHSGPNPRSLKKTVVWATMSPKRRSSGTKPS